MITIDGSHGEGGGSILRVAAGLSVVIQEPIKVIHIRAKRPQPGLKAQHLHGLLSVSEVCGGSLKGAELHSTEIEFTPNNDWKKKLEVKLPTAGSVGLVLQALQIACVHAPRPIEITFKGGATWGKWAPPLAFVRNITARVLKKMNYNIEIDILRDGFYPKGGAEAIIKINPTKSLKPLYYEEMGALKNIRGLSIASRDLEKAQIAERQKKAAREIIVRDLRIAPKITPQHADSASTGAGMILWAETENAVLGSGFIGEKGVRAETVGVTSAQDLIEELIEDNCVDRYTADQVIPFIALAANDSSIPVHAISKHVETNMWVVEKMLQKEIFYKDNAIITSRA